MGNNKKSNIFIYLPIFIMLLSITIMIGSTFAYFTDNTDEESTLSFSKVELSHETNVGINGQLRDALPGSPIISSAVKFSKSIDSGSIYVRAKLSFSTNSTNADMKIYLDALRKSEKLGIVTEEQNGAYWSEKEGNYFYLLNEDKTALKVVDDMYIYKLSESIVIPYDLEQLPNLSQYMEVINFHIAFQALQADNVTTNLNEVKQLFNITFPESENEKTGVRVVQYNNNGSENSTTELEVGTVIDEPVAVRDGYVLDGWFTKDGTDGDWGEQLIFPLTITADTAMYAKWSEEIKQVLAVKQVGLGSEATVTKVGLNAQIALSKTNTIYDTDEYNNAIVYKDIEIRAYKVGTKEIVAVLDKDGDDTNNTGNIMSANDFPWNGTYTNGTTDTSDDIQVDIYTYYPTHYVGYIPDGNGNFYVMISDKEMKGEIEVEEGVFVTANSMNVKKIEAYNRATFEIVYETANGFLTAPSNLNNAYANAIRFRSVAGQFVGANATMEKYRTKLTSLESSEGVNVNYNIEDYRVFDYRMLYLVKYSDYDCQAVVGNGITQNPSAITESNLKSLQTGNATLRCWKTTPNIANCKELAGRDGYVGTDGQTPVWCLGISNPWGNFNMYFEGLFSANGNIYYTEDESKYSSDRTSIANNFTAYNLYTTESAFNTSTDIYGSEAGKVDNPLMAFFVNSNNSKDLFRLKANTVIDSLSYSGCYTSNQSAGVFDCCEVTINLDVSNFAIRVIFD